MPHDPRQVSERSSQKIEQFSENDFSSLIARAGRQRMLSQRAGLVVMLMAWPGAGRHYQPVFADIIEQFSAAHADILGLIESGQDAGDLFPNTSEACFEGAGGVAKRIGTFLQQARALCRGAEAATEIDGQLAARFAQACMGSVLDDLEIIVSAIQKDCDAFLAKRNEVMARRAESIRQSVDDILAAAAFSRMVALNAKISAARAGEYGAEFSALTNEIKDVADRISKSSGVIRDHI